MGKWFVTPETVRIDLDGEWIEIKKELSIKDRRHITLGSIKSVREDKSYDIDAEKMSMVKVQTYLVDWSAVDAKQNKLPITAATIGNLRPEMFERIEAAIDAHVEALEVEGKATTGATAPDTTSPSVS